MHNTREERIARIRSILNDRNQNVVTYPQTPPQNVPHPHAPLVAPLVVLLSVLTGLLLVVESVNLALKLAG